MDGEKLKDYVHCLNSTLDALVEHAKRTISIKRAYSKKDILQQFFIREIKISRDMMVLMINESYYNAIVLACSLIESVVTYKYFTIFPKKLLDYKNFSYIEDLSRYKCAGKLIQYFGTSEDMVDEIHQEFDRESECLPDVITKYLLRFCKRNYKKFCKKGRVFRCDEDYLNRDNYVKYILPKYEQMFEEIIKNTANPTEWLVLRLQYERACQYKHFDAAKISNQFCYENQEIHFIEYQEDYLWCLHIVKDCIAKALKMSLDMKIISRDFSCILWAQIYWTFFSDDLMKMLRGD